MKTKNLFLLVVFIFLSLFSFALLSKSNFDSFPVTDINQQFLYAQGNNLVQGVNNQFLCHGYENIFGMRNTLYNNCATYITAFPGVSLIWSPLFSLDLSPMLFIINILFFLLIILFCKKIYQLLFGSNRFVWCFALIFPSLLRYTIIPYNNIASAALFIIVAYYLMEYYIYNKSYTRLFITLPFIALIFTLRTIDMVPILLLCLMLFLGKCNRRKIILSCFLGISVVVCLLPIFYFNNKLYSNILGPWNLEGKSILNIYQGPKDTKKDNNKYSITNLSTLKIKLWDINPIIILFFLLGFLSAYSRADHKYRKIYLLFLGIIFLQFVFYGSQTWSGINLKNTIGDSFSRYVLSSIVIVILFASFYFDYIRSKPIRIVSLFSLFLISFSIFLKGDFSFNDFNNQIIKSNIYKEMLGPRDVIFTSLRDKLLYPVGNFAIYTALPPEYRIEIVIKEIKRLLSAGYGVYFSKDSPAELDYTNDNYLDAFTSSGLKYSIITGDRTNFYKIEYKSHE